LISAKNRVDLSSISEVRSYITEWPRFLGHPVYPVAAAAASLAVSQQLLLLTSNYPPLHLLPP